MTAWKTVGDLLDDSWSTGALVLARVGTTGTANFSESVTRDTHETSTPSHK
jgi:hypothetical protein